MRYVHITLLAAAAACVLPFATPALAQAASVNVGVSPGCGRCGVSYNTEATLGGPALGPQLNMGVPSGASALAPESGAANSRLAKGCRVEVWSGTYPRQRHVVCR